MDKLQKVREVVNLRTCMSFPMITAQLLLFTYIMIVILIFLPGYAALYPLHIVVILALLGLAEASLVLTFKCDPGRVTMDIVEQIKLNLKCL